jgi:glyoxylase I family protein
VLNIRGIDHVVLRVRDMEAMARFYCDVLGAAFVAHRPEFRMTHLRVGVCMLDLVSADEARTGRNMDHLCLRVEPFDQDAIVSWLMEKRVAVGDIRERFGAEGNGVSIYLTDPEGNTVELKGPSDASPLPRR